MQLPFSILMDRLQPKAEKVLVCLRFQTLAGNNNQPFEPPPNAECNSN